MKKGNLIVLFVAALLTVAIFVMAGAFPLNAAQSDSDVLKKLNEVLQNQNIILEQLSELKAELVKIKYRVR